MNINIRLRNIFYLFTAGIILWFLYIERQILSPFILAMIFAYIFNPLINFFSRRLKIPRTISIIFVYIILISSAIVSGVVSTRSLFSETNSIKTSLDDFFYAIRKDIATTPDFVSPYLYDYVDYFVKNPLFGNFNSSPIPFVSKAFFGLINFFVFLFSAFFFLKDGGRIIEKLTLLSPNEYRVDISILIKKINAVLSSYLRGQIVLILSMIVMLMIAFTILGVKYRLTISVISALFEIVPFVGPLAAGFFGTFLIAVTGGITNYNLDTIQTVLVVASIYYVSRQIQDYLIQPYVIGKATKLHPLIILFSVLAGEHTYGVIGVLVAVPIAGSLKIIYEFIYDKIYEKDALRDKNPKPN